MEDLDNLPTSPTGSDNASELGFLEAMSDESSPEAPINLKKVETLQPPCSSSEASTNLKQAATPQPPCSSSEVALNLDALSSNCFEPVTSPDAMVDVLTSGFEGSASADEPVSQSGLKALLQNLPSEAIGRNVKRGILRAHNAALAHHNIFVTRAKALQDVWNSNQLGAGTQVDLCDEHDASNRHVSTWNPSGVQFEAFMSLNTTATKHTRRSLRELDAQALVSMSHRHAVEQYYKSEFDSIDVGSTSSPWLRINRALDETPMDLAFGKLADLLMPLARYWVTESKGLCANDVRHRLLTFDDYRLTKAARKNKRNGILEVCAQKCSVAIAKEIRHPVTDQPFVQVDYSR